MVRSSALWRYLLPVVLLMASVADRVDMKERLTRPVIHVRFHPVVQPILARLF